ncbi:dihydropteroate synthase [Oscillatoria laete-virens NRMC-F 0139]|nr:dihydropteroate synthase [Oscillatoria laete-virens]MDL5052329.1 dihydropteroate synthase [Oscillatoria laete-virens NRMC-F 0139]
MSLPGLIIIGERINPGFASSKALLEVKDLGGLAQLARDQVAKGAQYLTLNAGESPEKDPEFQIALTRAIQDAVDAPISFDSPNPRVQELYLKTYDPAKAQGRKPIINSIAQTRWEMVELLKIQPAKVVLMASERLVNGLGVANKTAVEVHEPRGSWSLTSKNRAAGK